MSQPHYVTETQILRRVAVSSKRRYIWTTHALKQMAKRGITAPDVEHALINGQVILVEAKKDILWRVQGSDIDGGKIEVVVAVFENVTVIKVVTTF